MNVCEAMRILDEKGSTDDPIKHRGEETTPSILTCSMSSLDDASKIRIGYYAGPLRKLRWVKNGTLSGMVKDRARLP